MNFKKIDEIVENGIFDSEAGVFIPIPIDKILIGAGVSNHVSGVLSAVFPAGCRYIVVSDQNTHKALGNSVEAQLGSCAKYIVFDNDIVAEQKHVDRLLLELESYDVLVAVGSGTINDLCKYSSSLANKPYVVCATAASMNGYSSANASISINGHKKSLAAQLPRIIIADLDVIANAPSRLAISGFGDSICRTTARADWLLSHHLLGAQYSELPFEMLKPYESELLRNAKGIKAGDAEVLAILMATLIISGLGMYVCGGSYPASQGEHIIAHVMEVVHGDPHLHSYHGEQIAVTSLEMVKIQESFLSQEKLQIKLPDFDKSAIRKYYGSSVGEQCVSEYRNKCSAIDIVALNLKLQKRWSEVRAEILSDFLCAEDIQKALKSAGAPLLYGDIGWQSGAYKDAIKFAPFLRNRFTFLDVLSVP